MGLLTDFLLYRDSKLNGANASAWVPPEPETDSLTAVTASLAVGKGEVPPTEATAAEPAPPVPAVLPPTVDVATLNAFGPDPFDANGCPILSPTDMEALATLPYSGFAAVSEAASDLPPLPAGYDVMPLATSDGIFVETEDVFRFRAISTNNSVPVSFFGRVQRPSGYIIPFNHTLTTSSANTTFTTQPVPGKGILLGCAASVPIGSITVGAVNAVGEIGRLQGGSFTPHTLLFSGQLDDQTPLTIDGGGLPTTTQRATFLGTSNAASVAPPKSIVITPSSGKRLRITRASATITTDATAGVRGASIAFQVNGISVFYSTSGGNVGPSCAPQFYAAIGGNGADNFVSGTSGGIPMSCPLPESLYFYEAVTVFIAMERSVAGDRVSDMFVRWEET